MFEERMDKMGDRYRALADANAADELDYVNLLAELVPPSQIVAVRAPEGLSESSLRAAGS
jgi:hypothetical protein